jgi:hypothetical protein
MSSHITRNRKMADPTTMLSDRRAPIMIPDMTRTGGFDEAVRTLLSFFMFR